MPNVRPSHRARFGLIDDTAPAKPRTVGWWPVVALLAAALLGLVLAWFDGGEEPLHAIADDVALPELEQ